MKPFDVYPLINITPVRAQGSRLWDDQGQEYIDLYGGHAVISIGHNHQHFNQRLKDQLDKITFYSNSVQIPIQQELASKLGELSGYADYHLFLCNSGAEANENALKLASFDTGKAGFISFSGAFHGRTSGAVALTDNPKIVAPFNKDHQTSILPFGDLVAVEQRLQHGDIAGVIIEGIQGINGIQVPEPSFLLGLATLCKQYGSKLILDEVQSGYARTGRFFAHQWVEGLQPDLITTAKGMGNGYPIGGVLIHPDFKASFGLLGTTFGGNHLACAAGLAVLEVIEEENLMKVAAESGDFLMDSLRHTEGVLQVRGKGLMVGVDLDREAAPVRNELIKNHHIFTGSSSGKNTIRLLPPLNIPRKDLTLFLESIQNVLTQPQYH
ncbi:MAG TPA: aminotransferase class III-fold pyridoxal phosphate-dependent enzyme [Cyclobacteriaceae bacterium]|nr:aminotransferase class III-fold pyridoxal phosphate-dependent enzyme [Cyclobacteriaceae bacterium]